MSNIYNFHSPTSVNEITYNSEYLNDYTLWSNWFKKYGTAAIDRNGNLNTFWKHMMKYVSSYTDYNNIFNCGDTRINDIDFYQDIHNSDFTSNNIIINNLVTSGGKIENLDVRFLFDINDNGEVYTINHNSFDSFFTSVIDCDYVSLSLKKKTDTGNLRLYPPATFGGYSYNFFRNCLAKTVEFTSDIPLYMNQYGSILIDFDDQHGVTDDTLYKLDISHIDTSECNMEKELAILYCSNKFCYSNINLTLYLNIRDISNLANKFNLLTSDKNLIANRFGIFMESRTHTDSSAKLSSITLYINKGIVSDIDTSAIYNITNTFNYYYI